MNKIPLALIYTRLGLGFAILCSSFFHLPYFSEIAITFFTLGLLTDIFDGIIARKYQLSTSGLRRLDSLVDQLFFLSVATAAYITWPNFFKQHTVSLLVLIGTELLAYAICLLKFRKEIATHTISSKFWTLLLFATLCQLLWTGNSVILFRLCFYAGLLTRLEIIGIILLLRQWAHDVPSLYHAILLRQGKPIIRHKLWNG